LEEKLRVCREVALAMQADDLAEYNGNKVEVIFAQVLKDADRAKTMFEHIQYRTGLLLERRKGVFGFAHLTFQEYLAARAVHEGNRLNVDAQRLTKEHNDGRWSEVIALYCGLATAAGVRTLLDLLVEQPDTNLLSTVLSEAYLSAGPELTQDLPLRRKVLERIAIAPALPPYNLAKFLPDEIAPLANECVGGTGTGLSESFRWLQRNPEAVNFEIQARKLKSRRKLSPKGISELLYLVHAFGSESELMQLASDVAIYEERGPTLGSFGYSCQAEIALLGLLNRNRPLVLMNPLIFR
jgi:hypothetical protein